MSAGKLIVAVCGAVSILSAAVIAWKSQRVLSLYFTVSSIVAGGLAGLFLLAFLSARANKEGAWIGIAACLIFTTWATMTSGERPGWDLGSFNFRLHPVMIGVAAHGVVLAAGYLASFLFAPPETASREMTLWGWLERKKTTLNELGGLSGLNTQPLREGGEL